MKFLKNLFNRKNKTSQAPLNQPKPLSWSEIVDECFDKQLTFTDYVSKVIYSDNREKRAVILLKPDGRYTVVFEILYPYEEDELKSDDTNQMHGFWSRYECSSSIFDTEERAVASVLSEPPFKYNA